MSKKKRIIIGIIIMGVIIIISSIIGISVYHSKNTESNTNSMQDNSITTINEIPNTDNNIQENVLEDEKVEENNINDITEQKDEESGTNNTQEQKKQESTTQASSKKQENQTTQTQNDKIKSTQNQQTIQVQENKPNQETTQVKPQKEQQTTKEETRKEETTSNPVVERCTTNNNHGMSIGNSGKWFKTKAEAIAEYDAEINKWGDKWTNYEISDEEYYKNCPYGYEVWTCPYCNLWTLNYYYD